MVSDQIIQRFRASLYKEDGETLRSPEELQMMALRSPAVHFGLFTTIQDKQNNTRSPVPNILQLRMSQAYETLMDLGFKIRIICVKPRQTGCSTFACHMGYHHGQRFKTEGITISDTKDHSKELKDKLVEFSKVDTFPWGNQMVRNPSGFVEWMNGTKWTVDTAENPDAGVGGTRQFGHFSETAKWPQTKVKNDVKTATAALNSLSGDQTVVIVESTPEGAVGFHYKTWQKAVTIERFLELYEQGFRQEVWIKVFAAWFEFPEHSRKEPVSEAEIAHMKESLTEREREEIIKYKLSWEQVAWRRDKITQDCGGDEKVFLYYFPSDEVSCFIASGSPRFDMGILQDMGQLAQGQAFDSGWLSIQHDQSVAFGRDSDGDIQVWEAPQEGHKYLVSIDPATDASQTIGADPDRHSVLVWRKGYYCPHREEDIPTKLVARVKPPYYAEGDEVAGHAVRLSRFYGNCIVCQEINRGSGIMRLLIESGVPLYKRRPTSLRTGQVVEQPGFKLKDDQLRAQIIEGFASALRDRAVDIPCEHVIEECKMFVRKPNGRAEAAGGAHDDDCFVAGTQILTPDGQVAIESLKVGDLVITRDGPRRIGRLFSKVKPVISNLGLVGTATHPVITPAGEKSLHSLEREDTLYMWNESLQITEKRSFTEGRNTIGIPIPREDSSVFIFGDMINGRNLLSRCIGRSGSIITDRFLRSILSITRMATLSTTRLEIWRSCLLGRIQACTSENPKPCVLTGRTDADRLPELSKPWPNGVSAQRHPQYIPLMQRRDSLFLRGMFAVASAAIISLLLSGTRSIALAAAWSGSKIRRHTQRRRVYNLHVEGSHEYFANGILVHNCLNSAMAWECIPSATLFKPHVVKPQNPRDRGKHGWRAVTRRF